MTIPHSLKESLELAEHLHSDWPNTSTLAIGEKSFPRGTAVNSYGTGGCVSSTFLIKPQNFVFRGPRADVLLFPYFPTRLGLRTASLVKPLLDCEAHFHSFGNMVDSCLAADQRLVAPHAGDNARIHLQDRFREGPN